MGESVEVERTAPNGLAELVRTAIETQPARVTLDEDARFYPAPTTPFTAEELADLDEMPPRPIATWSDGGPRISWDGVDVQDALRRGGGEARK